MSSVCWFEDRERRLTRARALAATEPAAALALVESVLSECPDDAQARYAKGAVLVDVADAERDPARAAALYREAIALLQGGGREPDADLRAAQRGLEAALRER